MINQIINYNTSAYSPKTPELETIILQENKKIYDTKFATVIQFIPPFGYNRDGFISALIEKYKIDFKYEIKCDYMGNTTELICSEKFVIRIQAEDGISIFCISALHCELEDLLNKFSPVMIEENILAKWQFLDVDRRLDYVQSEIYKNKAFYSELYPYINVNKTIHDFMGSSSPVLILLGEPGTGKTSFINELIFKGKFKEPWLVYDSETANDEMLYINFLNSPSNLMIFEDSDILISDRIKDNNSKMAKILNISNGLMSLKNKKFIFTANLKTEDEIDRALTRPGRCFDIINFRSLTASEVKIFEEKTGIMSESEGSLSISEIFNSRKTKQKFKVGF